MPFQKLSSFSDNTIAEAIALRRDFALFIRNGAVELQAKKPETHDLTLSLGVEQWAQIAAGDTKLTALLEQGAVSFFGDAKLIEAFLKAYAQVL